MKKITTDEARSEMYRLLKKVDMGDKIYELAQDIFQGCINVIEINTEITDKDEYLDSCQEWYDEIQEDFYQTVYDMIQDFFDATV